jgi:hypothetical protein
MVKSPMSTDTKQPKIKDLFGTPDDDALPKPPSHPPETITVGNRNNLDPPKTINATPEDTAQQHNPASDDNASYDPAVNFLNTPHADDIFINDDGYEVIYNVNLNQAMEWYSQTTNNWKKWSKLYNGNFDPFQPNDRASTPGLKGYKNARLVLTRLITKNSTTDPTTIERYIKSIKEIWNEQGTLGKTQKGQKLREFVIRTAATWPLDFFLQDWDKNGYLHASEDTKAWWAVQKLTGFHCHRRKAVDDATAHQTEDDDMEIELELDDIIPASEISTNKRKSQDEDKMDTMTDKTTTSSKTTMSPGQPAPAPHTPPLPTVSNPITPAAADSIPPNAWTTAGPTGKPVKPPKKKFTLPIAQRVKTLRQVKLPGCKTPHNTYFDVTINLPKHDKPQKKFLSILKDLWKNLKALDDDAIWHTYRATSRDSKSMSPITKTAHFPKTFMASRKYLRSLSGVNKEGGKIYTTILVGHDLPPKEIQDCMREWASVDDHFFFERTVQAEQVITVAWGFGSPSDINCEDLAHHLMEKLNAKFQIGCKDRFIADGSAWSKNPAPKDLNRKAVHFEAPEEHALELYRFLVSIYGSTRPIADMPYMLDLKIIPDWTSCRQGKLGAFGTDMLMNCQQMILKQGLFRKHTEQFPVSDIGHLDQPLEGVSKTLREVIMEITVKTSDQQTNATSDERLFHSILPRKGSTDHILTYPKVHAATAVAMITGLIPFVLHHYGEATRKWFSLRALDGSSAHDGTKPRAL